MINKEAALKKMEELVQRFEEQILSYKKTEYNHYCFGKKLRTDEGN